MKDNFPKWLTKKMVRRISGFNLDAYLIALEGWRRGLTLNWYLDPAQETDLKIIGFFPLGKSFSLQSKENKHFFYRSRGDKVANEAVDIGTNKQQTREKLEKANVPTPKGKDFHINDLEEMLKYAEQIGYPVVVKPTLGSLGKGVTTNIQSEAELIKAIEHVKDIGYENIIIEEYFEGEDYRIYVVDGEVVAATKRVPANVVGDGKQTIEQLIKEKNKLRKENPYLRTKLIEVDDNLRETLKKQDLGVDDVPEKGKKIYVRSVANISTGGDPVDVTERLPSDIKNIAIDALSSITNFTHGGIDILIDSTSQYRVIEINPTADISMHIFPIVGKPRNVPKSIVEYYFPETTDYPEENKMLYFDYRGIRRMLARGIVQNYQVSKAPAKLYKTRYIVSGKVQKVSYRHWIRRQAVRKGLHGYTRNLKNGNVIVVVGGEEKKVKDFKKICKQGSRRAKVKEVKELAWNREIRTGFIIKKSEG